MGKGYIKLRLKMIKPCEPLIQKNTEIITITKIKIVVSIES